MEGEETLAQPKQRRHQRTAQADQAGPERQRPPVLGRPRAPARSQPPASERVENTDRDERRDDPGIKGPARMCLSLRAAMRVGRAAERGHDEGNEVQRSHPLSTREAAPCISSANVKTSAASALSRDENGRLRSSPIDGRLSRRQDSAPEPSTIKAPKKEMIAETWCLPMQSAVGRISPS